MLSIIFDINLNELDAIIEFQINYFFILVWVCMCASVRASTATAFYPAVWLIISAFQHYYYFYCKMCDTLFDIASEPTIWNILYFCSIFRERFYFYFYFQQTRFYSARARKWERERESCMRGWLYHWFHVPIDKVNKWWHYRYSFGLNFYG